MHDPLVEWKKQKGPPESVQKTVSRAGDPQPLNYAIQTVPWSRPPQAVTIIKDIEDRISGKGSKSKVPPLSITGQVHQLILVG